MIKGKIGQQCNVLFDQGPAGDYTWEFELLSMASKLKWLFLAPLVVLISIDVLCAQDKAERKRLYTTYCSNCHGASGKGDGLAAESLPDKPADHTDGKFMSQLSDKYLSEIISKGGSGVGKSPFMPAWGTLLKDQQIRDIVSYVRSLSIPPYNSTGK